jgi:glycolate oxidase FAD binding subunit
VLDVSALSGIVSYEPAELVLTALAGTPMSVIEAALAEHQQCLAFEPPHFGSLLGADVDGTLGGTVAVGLSGPRRFKVGAVRDHVLGIAAVSGRGEAFVAGGKVVKNVTGYDVPKLMAGSYGTLAVLTEITVKVLPRPQDERTVAIAGLGVRDAVRAMTLVLQSPTDVSGACYLPVVPWAEGSMTAFRLEGFSVSVEARLGELTARLSASVQAGQISTLDRDTSAEFWRGVRDVRLFDDVARAALVWRLSVPSAAAVDVVERLERSLPGAKMFLDWGGGLIWIAVDSIESAESAESVRGALANCGGHATLMRAPTDVRARVDVFQPPVAAVAALSKRVKAQFDPARVLNPGRMYADV